MPVNGQFCSREQYINQTLSRRIQTVMKIEIHAQSGIFLSLIHNPVKQYVVYFHLKP